MKSLERKPDALDGHVRFDERGVGNGAHDRLLRHRQPKGSATATARSTRHRATPRLYTDLLYYGYRYYGAAIARWISLDPLEEDGGPNLSGFCGNDPIERADGLGLAFYALGGTWETAKEQANPWWMSQETKEVPARFFPGPNAPGTDSAQIALYVYDIINQDFCAARKAGTEFTINLTGWSRGAVIAVQVAALLDRSGLWCLECSRLTLFQPVKVNWMGLFDAVSRMPPRSPLPWPSDIPRNVAHFNHAVKTDTDSWYQRIMRTVHYATPTERAFNKYNGTLTTHADIGESKKRGNNDSYNWIKAQAVASGVKF